MLILNAVSSGETQTQTPAEIKKGERTFYGGKRRKIVRAGISSRTFLTFLSVSLSFCSLHISHGKQNENGKEDAL